MGANVVQSRIVRTLPLAVSAAAIAFALVWVLFVRWKGQYGSAVDDPTDFLITLLNGVTLAGLLFIVASGFTLIFGSMRAVNMAHGAPSSCYGATSPSSSRATSLAAEPPLSAAGSTPPRSAPRAGSSPILTGRHDHRAVGLDDQQLHNQQLHIFLPETDAPQFHHIGLDDFEAVYLKAKERGLLDLNTSHSQIWEHPATSLAR